MKSLLSRLTNLGIVASVLQGATSYRSLENGFVRDRENLRGDAQKVTSAFNKNIKKYGDKKYAS